MNIFIDFDGPIVDNFQRHVGLFFNLANKFNFIPIPEDKYWLLKKDCTPENEILDLCLGISPKKKAAYLDCREKLIETPEYLARNQLVPHCMESLKFLGNKGRLVLVTTRQNREALLWELTDKKIDHLFSEILCGFDMHMAASDLKYNMIMSRNFHLSRKDLIIGDTEAEILCGKKLGIITVATLNGIRNEARLTCLKPDFIFSDITGVIQSWENIV